jgi:hypothetical protein
MVLDMARSGQEAPPQNLRLDVSRLDLRGFDLLTVHSYRKVLIRPSGSNPGFDEEFKRLVSAKTWAFFYPHRYHLITSDKCES